jgi:hypothetical protein
MLRSNSIIYSFFDQCERDAEASGKIPFLIVRENKMPKNQHYIFLDFNFEQGMKIENYITAKYYGANISLAGYPSKKFFEKVSLETLKWIYERD